VGAQVTRVLVIYLIAPALLVAHVVRCVWAEARDRRRELREHRVDGRARLRLVPRDELADRRDRRMGGAA
jgi:hypothetical protein